jgi:hypothetical protein
LQLVVPVGWNVDDPGPEGDPLHFLGLGDSSATVDGLEAVAPYRGFTAALLGDEGKLPAGVSSEDSAAARPAEEVE